MTSTIEALATSYEREVKVRWEEQVAFPLRVWFAVYPQSNERRLRLRLTLFETATKRAGKTWVHTDLTSSFATWMAAHDSREDYFQAPEGLSLGLKRFEHDLAKQVTAVLAASDASTVVALSGIGALFGLASVSRLVSDVTPSIKGRLLVFFPGSTENGLFKLLDATKGYNYLARAITPEGGE